MDRPTRGWYHRRPMCRQDALRRRTRGWYHRRPMCRQDALRRRRWPWPPVTVANRRRIRAIHVASGADDAETLARLFEDRGLEDDGTLCGRLEAVLDATAHRWVPGMHTFLDVPGLHELRGHADRGFRPEFSDPWRASCDQGGHLLTALALAINPARLEERRVGMRVRDLVGAPRSMSNREVAIRLTVGHEKAPDPRPAEPLVLAKVRRQFAAATAGDAIAFETALARLAGAFDLDLEPVAADLDRIAIGRGPGNSRQDLALSLAGFHLAALFTSGAFRDGQGLAAWLRRNVAASDRPRAHLC
jgi:hypothetical protein